MRDVIKEPISYFYLLSERDFKGIQVKANEKGLPYQTLLSSIIHNNFQKHGVDFEEAKTIFNDRLAIIIEDSSHSNYEQR